MILTPVGGTVASTVIAITGCGLPGSLPRVGPKLWDQGIDGWEIQPPFRSKRPGNACSDGWSGREGGIWVRAHRSVIGWNGRQKFRGLEMAARLGPRHLDERRPR
ncbi:MAG: hypothetical protein BMS9Abin29_2553 [Gemmatimonadota bacterium]|nr:MAG: hypothetical protein BMS9Abin29_2553 [Gemmatimonadota bacterium]